MSPCCLHALVSPLQSCNTQKYFFRDMYLFCETRGKEDGDFEVHAVPVGFEQNAEFLSTAQREHGNQHLQTETERMTCACVCARAFRRKCIFWFTLGVCVSVQTRGCARTECHCTFWFTCACVCVCVHVHVAPCLRCRRSRAPS